MIEKRGSNVEHHDVMSWKEGGVEFSAKAKEKMIEAAMEEGKGLTSYNPLSEPTAEKYVR
jgi:hypothetical protein